ncbi:thiamine phosphate synthase [Enterococcus crotali]|uniref:thiamine phosphate synthase n=1 Tax=Enterococcus crotali TaxID=1453587 RepID=UPI00047287D1|nr:thiamine phosphate synthase [Enterococcus crotali]OTP47445.1 thiamine-phosphate pyrophosphorylase [Enterococcus termitis]
MKNSKEMLSVYFIAGTQDIQNGDHLPSVLESALKAGITCFQYREKGKGSLPHPEAKKEMAQICQQLCEQYQVPFLINDDVALALEIGADGIHVGQKDQAIEEVLTLFTDKIVGLSCHDEQEVLVANELAGITYYGIGPIYGTISKEDAELPIGIAKLKELTEKACKPVVAIGGINTKNAQSVLETHVDGVSVITAITLAKDIKEAVGNLKQH